jgi:hypothetical protein
VEGWAYRRDKGVDVLLTSEWGEGVDNLIEPHLRPVVPSEALIATATDAKLAAMKQVPKAASTEVGAAASTALEAEGLELAAPEAGAEETTPATAAGLEAEETTPAKAFSPAVGRLGREMSPRYHFAGGQAVRGVWKGLSESVFPVSFGPSLSRYSFSETHSGGADA